MTGGRQGAWRALPFVLLFVAGLLLFPSTGRDDKYISFWPAVTLAEQGEMLNYNGERVEQSSTLLLVLAVAALVRAGIDPVLAGWLCSLAGGWLSVWGAGVLARRIDDRLELPAMLVTSQIPYLVYWSFGGMEATLAAAGALGVTLAVADLAERGPERRRLAVAGLAILAFSMVRPEAPFVAMAGVAAMLAWIAYARLRGGTVTANDTRGIWALVAALGLMVLVLAGLMAFRAGYFGSVFPQPVAVKHTGGGGYVIRQGLRYLKRNMLVWPIAIPALVGVARFVLAVLKSSAQPTARGATVAFTCAYGGFVLATGGDWMEGGRFLVPFLPLTAVLAVDLLVPFARSRAALAVGLLTLAGTLGMLRFAARESIAVPLWVAVDLEPVGDRRYHWLETVHREHRRDMHAVTALARTLDLVRPHVTRPIPFFAHNVGMAVYHTARREAGGVRVIDMRGLSDRYISDSRFARKVPRTVLGIEMGPEAFLEQFDAIQADTGVPFPVIIYAHAEAETERYDFLPAFEVLGRVDAPPPFVGRAVPSSQHVSVYGPLARRLDASDWPIHFDVSAPPARSP